MKNQIKNYSLIIIGVGLLSVLFLTGCKGTVGNTGKFMTYEYEATEAVWIRNGEPIEYEEMNWFPADGVESFLDAEMQLMGEHRGVKFFVDKVDVRPYDRLYTKFDRNKFRFFEQRP